MIAQQSISPYDMFDYFPEIKLQAITLRELDISDAEDLLGYISHPDVNRFISDEDIPHTIEEARREVDYWGGLFRYRQSIYWGIADSQTDALIGTCGYNFWNRLHRKAEISYDLAHPYWNKGLMTAALKAVVAYGFNTMQLQRISATVSPDNPASIRILEKLGFQYEGRMKDYKIVQGKFDDALMYAVLREQYYEGSGGSGQGSERGTRN